MPRSNDLLIHPLPKHCWPARQKERLDRPGATDRFQTFATTLSQQTQASGNDRYKIFIHLTESLQSIFNTFELDERLAICRDLRFSGCPEGSKSKHRAVAVGYSAAAISRGQGMFFPLDSPIPAVDDLRTRRLDALDQASFLLLGDGGSRVFRGSGVPSVLRNSLEALGKENFNLIDPMKAFQTSSYNHVACPLGLLAHLSFIYQCEIREDAKVLLSVIWVKLVEDDDDTQSISTQASGTRKCASKRYCKAPIASFDVSDSAQAAKLLTWLHAISMWSLRERVDALRMAQQIDEVRQRRFQQASISLLQEFGADLSTVWLSDHVLNSIPGPPSLERSRVKIGVKTARSPASSVHRTPTKRAKRQRALTPPPPLVSPPPALMSWKGLLPSHKLDGFQKDSPVDRTERGRGRLGESPVEKPERGRARFIEDDNRSDSSGRSISADKLMASKKTAKQDLAERLSFMTAIYDAVLTSPEKIALTAHIPLNPMPVQPVPVAVR